MTAPTLTRRLPPRVLARARARARSAAVRAIVEEHRDAYEVALLAALEHQLTALGEIPGQLDMVAELAACHQSAEVGA